MKTKLILGSVGLVAALGLWEGRLFLPYKDIVGVWTVCAGITGPEVIPGRRYSLNECNQLETKAIKEHQEGLLQCLKAPVSQETFDALSLFAYNVGVAGACRSTAVRLINEGNLSGGCEALLMWSKAGGQFVKGLWNRRVFERDLCMKGLS